MNRFDVDDVPFTDVSPSGGQDDPYGLLVFAAARMKRVRFVVGILEREVLDMLPNLIALQGRIELTIFTGIIRSRRGSANRCIRRRGRINPVGGLIGNGRIPACHQQQGESECATSTSRLFHCPNLRVLRPRC